MNGEGKEGVDKKEGSAEKKRRGEKSLLSFSEWLFTFRCEG
jgi:hypothetical protein